MEWCIPQKCWYAATSVCCLSYFRIFCFLEGQRDLTRRSLSHSRKLCPWRRQHELWGYIYLAVLCEVTVTVRLSNSVTWRLKGVIVGREKTSIARHRPANTFPWQPKRRPTSTIPGTSLANSPLNTSLNNGGLPGSDVFSAVRTEVI
jgi:hypothetical protein